MLAWGAHCLTKLDASYGPASDTAFDEQLARFGPVLGQSLECLHRAGFASLMDTVDTLDADDWATLERAGVRVAQQAAPRPAYPLPLGTSLAPSARVQAQDKVFL